MTSVVRMLRWSSTTRIFGMTLLCAPIRDRPNSGPTHLGHSRAWVGRQTLEQLEHRFHVLGAPDLLRQLLRLLRRASRLDKCLFQGRLEREDFRRSLLAGFDPRLVVGIDVNQRGIKPDSALV